MSSPFCVNGFSAPLWIGVHSPFVDYSSLTPFSAPLNGMSSPFCLNGFSAPLWIDVYSPFVGYSF